MATSTGVVLVLIWPLGLLVWHSTGRTDQLSLGTHFSQMKYSVCLLFGRREFDPGHLKLLVTSPDRQPTFKA